MHFELNLGLSGMDFGSAFKPCDGSSPPSRKRCRVDVSDVQSLHGDCHMSHHQQPAFRLMSYAEPSESGPVESVLELDSFNMSTSIVASQGCQADSSEAYSSEDAESPRPNICPIICPQAPRKSIRPPQHFPEDFAHMASSRRLTFEQQPSVPDMQHSQTAQFSASFQRTPPTGRSSIPCRFLR